MKAFESKGEIQKGCDLLWGLGGVLFINGRERLFASYMGIINRPKSEARMKRETEGNS
jgi:hypothetical protein